MSTATVIYHNPSCGTSRKVLGMLRDAGIEPRVVLYLKTPPTRAELLDLLNKMNMSPRALLRRKEAAYRDLGLADAERTDAELVDAMLAHPILIERPIVVGPHGVALCRPAERVRELLTPMANSQKGNSQKGDK
jgi:arsenate reductase (glutaredoxin)